MSSELRIWKRRAVVAALAALMVFCLWQATRVGAQIARNADQVLNAIYDATNIAIHVEGASGGTALPISFPAGDPCANPGIAKSSAIVSLTTSGQLVALSAGKIIYLCDAVFTLAGTAPTAQFITGTGAVCATGPSNLTGAYAPTSGSEVFLSWGGTVLSTPASQALCLTLAGTTPSAQGVVTYVQQ